MTNFLRLFALLFIALGAMALSCHTYSTQPGGVPHSALSLTAPQVTTSSAELVFTNDSSAISNRYILLRNGGKGTDTVFSGAVPRDSATQNVYDRALSPERTYQYSVYRMVGATRFDSASVQVRTGDTTKDAYNFTFYRLGETQSVLTGIWTDGPQNIWVCGSIDSQSVQRDYGIAHIVNGNVTLYISTGASGIGRPQSVYGLNDTTVWFASPGNMLWWNGTKLIIYSFAGGDPTLPTWPYQYWCLYVAPDGEVFSGADNGRILHLKADLKTWELMQAPTYYDIGSMKGFAANNIYAVANNSNFNGILLHYDGTAWDSVPYDTSIQPEDFGIWGESPDSLYIFGAGLYQQQGAAWKNITPSSEIYVLGTMYSEGPDNIFIGGQDNFVAKWDGIKWNHYTTPFPPNVNAGLYQIFMLNGVFYGAGGDENGGYYVIGQ